MHVVYSSSVSTLCERSFGDFYADIGTSPHLRLVAFPTIGLLERLTGQTLSHHHSPLGTLLLSVLSPRRSRNLSP